ncbi:MAG: hypothetical protein PHU51_02120 [Candidatus Nanoarchaeia archaeon]|nr:hypothetical protein [Candidatus Nanoarchaeia archaeon]
MHISQERIKEILNQVIGEPEAEDIIFYLRGKSNISEFIITEELDMDIHRTRKILYKLHDYNLVSFKRKKDKIKGWYICYWDFNEHSIPILERKLRAETLKKLEERLQKETANFYYMCRAAHTRMTFDDAFDEDFKCPECGDIMQQVENARTVDFLKNRIEEIKVEIAKDDEELKVAKATMKAEIEQKRKEERELMLKKIKEEEERRKGIEERRKLAEETKIKREERKKELEIKREEMRIKREELAKKKERDDLAKKKAELKKKVAVKKVVKKVVKKKTIVKKISKKVVKKKPVPKKVVKKALKKTPSKSTKKQPSKSSSKKPIKKKNVKKAIKKKTVPKKVVKKSLLKSVIKKVKKAIKKKR